MLLFSLFVFSFMVSFLVHICILNVNLCVWDLLPDPSLLHPPPRIPLPEFPCRLEHNSMRALQLSGYKEKQETICLPGVHCLKMVAACLFKILGDAITCYLDIRKNSAGFISASKGMKRYSMWTGNKQTKEFWKGTWSLKTQNCLMNCSVAFAFGICTHPGLDSSAAIYC